ncbi:MAG: alpha/beta fold hydrolase [Lentisphaeria bacterium]|nr:alpha/beta fold hydrolase [Lentisphaeria bacterium]
MEKNDRDTSHKNDTLVILIHGFCRGAKDMQFWKKHLKKTFPHILTPDLPTRYSSFERCLQVLTEEISAASPEQYKELCIAGHSMGGLLAREYLARNCPANAGKLICVGTPHYGSRLADIALLLPGAGRIWKPLHALKLSARKVLTVPPVAGLETAIIVSTNNGHWPGKLFLSRESDGLVEKHSALAEDAKHIAYTQASHISMQYDLQTADLILKFFTENKF